MSTPQISVIVPTYNREHVLERALDSIVAQTVDDWEIIVIDDGSTDGTPDVAARYGSRLKDRFTYVHQENRGAGAARNRGIDAARGRYVAFLDSDDEFLPTKLERQLALLDLRPKLGLVYSDYVIIETDGIRHDSAFAARHPLARTVDREMVAPGLHVCGDALMDVLFKGYFISTIVGMVRRDVLGESIRFNAELSFGEEWLFFLEVSRCCRAGFVDEPLSIYHCQPGSLTQTDKRRNVLNYIALLRAMNHAFRDLPRSRRLPIRRNLTKLCRQVGYDDLRAGRPAQAIGRFAEAFRISPGLSTLRELARAAVCRLGRTSAPQPGYPSRSQELPEVVR